MPGTLGMVSAYRGVLQFNLLIINDFLFVCDGFVEAYKQLGLPRISVPLAAHQADVKSGVRPADR